MFVSFDYADVPSDSRLQLRLERDGLVVVDTDEAWEQGRGTRGSANLLISDDPHVLVPGSYQLKVMLAGQTLGGRFAISATRGEPGAHLIADQFDDNLLNWEEFVGEEAAAEIQDGRLVIGNYVAGVYSWSALPPLLEDFDLSVDAWQTAGPTDGYYGVVFRSKEERHYLFLVSVEGYFEVGISTDDSYESLISYRQSSAIKLGAEVNHLRVAAQGDHFAFYVNGERVATLADDRLKRGAIGLVSGDNDRTGMASAFDNLLITLPLEAVEVLPTPTVPPAPRATAVPAPTSTPEAPPLVTLLEETRNHAFAIGGAMDRIYHEGRPEACAPLLSDYYAIVNAPAFDVSSQPSNVQTAYALYRDAIGIIADKIGKIRDICESGGGTIGGLDFDVCRMAVNDAIDRLSAALSYLQ